MKGDVSGAILTIPDIILTTKHPQISMEVQINLIGHIRPQTFQPTQYGTTSTISETFGERLHF
jgi:hypothetical protein